MKEKERHHVKTRVAVQKLKPAAMGKSIGKIGCTY